MYRQHLVSQTFFGAYPISVFNIYPLRMETKKIPDYPTLREPIAIVGMSCRFPKAETLNDFWELLINEQHTITEIPADRWDLSHYYDPDPDAEHKSNQRHGSFLSGIHDFDPLVFGISPAEAQEMNPSQKLMLELVWEAIENTNLPFDHVKGQKAGVYIGNIWSDFEHFRKEKNAKITSHSAIGQSSNIIANRLSFTYGFTGPSMVIDTGCSSSLVALNLACQSLWDGTTPMAIVGAVNHILDPYQNILLSKFGGLSPTGRCNAFDNSADGFVRGEGGAIILLMPLSAAEREGAAIHAVIRGMAMNNNGFNINLPATSTSAQKQMLEDAYRSSGILPHEVHYVEAHGTGTRVGDPAEARALGEFFSQRRKTNHLRLGSVKTNIGHLEAAAGIAGLLKVVLAMQHQVLPASLNFKTPSTKIAFEELRLEVQQKASPWPSQNGESLKAGINSFGWGGTNAHVIIEQYKGNHNTLPSDYKKERWCLPLSAKTPEALKAYVKKYQARITATTSDEWKDICLTSSLRKPHFTYRALFSASTKEMLLEAFEHFHDNTGEHTTSPSGLTVTGKVVMVFPGQGAQWLGMGKDLLEKETIFRECIEQTDKVLRQFCDWSLLDQLDASPQQSRLNEIDVIQPTLFAIQLALAKLWISWGITPHAVVGHSMGEIAAACIAGAIDLHDAARIICVRSKLMRTLSGKGGAMVVTELSFRDAESLLVRYPACSIAVSNSPKSTVLAGDQESILRLITELESAGVFCRQVKVDVASHSSQMDPILSELHEALTLVNPHPGAIPFYSTAINSMLPGNKLNADYWIKNLRNPVHFADTMQKLVDTDHKIFIEITPHPLLSSAIQECAAHANKKILVVHSLQREKPGQEILYSQLGELFTQGFDINWKTFYQTDKAPAISLPTYPFQRERYEPEIRSHNVKERNKNQDYPLAGNLLSLANQDEWFFWETEISIHSLPFLKDHRVNNEVIVPGAALIEMVFEGAREIFKDNLPSIDNLKFLNTISLTLEETATVQLKIRKDANPITFTIYRKTSDLFNKTSWELLAQGELKINKTFPSRKEIDFGDDEMLYSGNEYYAYLKSLGLDYGPYFKGVTEIKKNERADQIIFRLQSSDLINKSSGKYTIHPALLDACLQPLFCGYSGENPEARRYTSFLSGVDEISLLESVKPFQEFQGIATLYPCEKTEEGNLSQVRADIFIFTSSGKPLMAIRGLTGKIINTGASKKINEALDNWRFKITWEKLPDISASGPNKEPDSGTWLVLGDPYGISDQFIKKMQAKKFHWVHVIPGDCFTKIGENRYTMAFGNKKDYESVLNACPALRGIIHLSSLNYAWKGSGVTAEQIEKHQLFGSLSFIFLYQLLAERKFSPMPSITIVTNGVQAVTDPDVAQPMHRPLWGLAKVMQNESPELPLVCFDLNADPTEDQIDGVIQHLMCPDPSENEIALRTGRHVPRLRRASEEILSAAFPQEFRDDVTYLITGYKGIAFEFIEWMIRKGARHFALLSRSAKISTSLESRIQALQKNGCHLKAFPVDVANYPALKKTIERIEKYMAPIGGVVHAAGVIKANSIADITAGEFLHTLSPKMKGAWNLHLLTREKALHCFISFSSASTLIGLSGQGSYVAANAFLDGLAYMRRRSGLPGLSVNWGVIGDSGMVANDPELERYASEEGFKPLKMKQAIDVFEKIYRLDYAQISVVDINLTRMATYYPQLAKSNYFKDLLRPMETSAPANGKRSYPWNDLTTTDEITGALQDFLIKEVSRITRVAPARIKPMMTFKELGLDSIMAIQLRNKLGDTFALNLSVGMFWSHPSIGEYTSFIHHLLSGNQISGGFKTTLNSKWLTISKAHPSAMFRIFCFHDAGGDSTLFRGWEDQMGDTFEVVALELPGRGENSEEEMPLSSEDLVGQLKEELRPYLNKPYLFFGHSMGGLLAFETARALRHEELQQPELIVLSSVPALNTYVKQDIEFEKLSAEIPNLRTMDAGIRKSVLRLLKNDLRMISSYRYVASKPLNLDLLAIRGREDLRITDQQVKQWKEETTGSFKVITRPGGHRYITEDSYFLTSLIFSEWSLMRRQTGVPTSENLILST